ncbi:MULTISPECIES: DUF805 domain-containing protein [unclassified Flavobacterium]|uniref:DUF805 domain-containing protein n=1 Tax=unclassified Flavobacterium TaxID=196869 RepID=UPI001F1379DF|nr:MULTISPECIES: DUF805 domain-containing protein [unclassified Flavobacterium]UMY66456.1 DUF805 domain-containing protein [Flavobacterium sp. HJ-32-4]
MKYFLNVLKQYAQFRGRTTRREYWMAVLFHIIFLIAAYCLDQALGLNFEEGSGGPFYLLYLLGGVLPMVAAAVRRLHDTGNSGWYFFIQFVPLVGPIWLIVLLAGEGQPRENQYGPDPYGNEIDEIGM